MNQRLRREDMVPAEEIGSRTRIEAFLGVSLPEGFEINPTDAVELLDQSALGELMLERPPFFFIEKAAAIADGNGTFKTVFGYFHMTEAHVAGHFQGCPIVPLIELCKGMAQTGIALAALQGNETVAPIAISAGASKATAKSLIDAPARILTRVELTGRRAALSFVDGVTYLVNDHNTTEIGRLERIVYTLVLRTELLKGGVA